MIIEDNAVGGLPFFNGSYEAGDDLVGIGAVIRAESDGRVGFIEIEVVLILGEVAEHCLVLLVMAVENEVVRAFARVQRCTGIEEYRSCFVFAAVKRAFEVVFVAVLALALNNGEGDVGIVYLHPADGVLVYGEKLFCAGEKLSAVVAGVDMRYKAAVKVFERAVEEFCA